jgi:NADH dehydrogenase FAD-containing subunit
MTTKKTVLVIGGGISGDSAIVGLRKYDKEVEIVLVEPKDYCESAWAAYRSPFDEATAKASLHPLEPFCKKSNVNHIQSVVTKLTNEDATLENGDVIKFDTCVISTGRLLLFLDSMT